MDIYFLIVFIIISNTIPNFAQKYTLNVMIDIYFQT